MKRLKVTIEEQGEFTSTFMQTLKTYFFEYIHSLDPDEIQQLDDDNKSNGWGVTDLLEIDNSLELLLTFQLFYHNNGRLLLTSGLIIVPDGEVPEGEEKKNLESLYENFRKTRSHGFVSMQFLGVLGILFGVGVKESRNAITELYKNLLYSTLSRGSDFNFDAISEFIGTLSFSIKKSTLADRDREEVEDAKKAREIIDTTTFVELPDPHEQEILDS